MHRLRDAKFPAGAEVERIPSQGKRTCFNVYLFSKKIGFIVKRGRGWVTSDLSLDRYANRAEAVTALCEEVENV